MPSAPAFEIDPTATFEVTFATDKGDIVALLDAKLAPNTVNHFVVQARNGLLRRPHLPPRRPRLRHPGR